MRCSGFRDVDVVHGPSELGRDVIGKQDQEVGAVQIAVQCKCGSVNARSWRDDIQPQVIQAATTSFIHPRFDSALPRQIIACTNETFNVPASQAIEALSINAKTQWGVSVDTWDCRDLASLLASAASRVMADVAGDRPDLLHRFLEVLGRIRLNDCDRWTIRDLLSEATTHAVLEEKEDLLMFLAGSLALEARAACDVVSELEIIGVTFCLVHHNAAYFAGASDSLRILEEEFVTAVQSALMDYEDIEPIKKTIREGFSSPGGFLAGNAAVHHAIEILSLQGLLCPDSLNNSAEMLRILIADFPCAGHIISDHYGVSIVLATILLMRAGDKTRACQLVRRASVWLMSCYGDRFGISAFDGDLEDDARQLVGFYWEAANVTKRHSSLAVTALYDLASLFLLDDLASLIRNDIAAIGMSPCYYEVTSSDSVSWYEPNIAFHPNLADSHYPESDLHLSLRVENETVVLGDSCLTERQMLIIALSLRDRYFPSALLRSPAQ